MKSKTKVVVIGGGVVGVSTLYHLAKNYEQLWLEYIGKLDAQGIKRKTT